MTLLAPTAVTIPTRHGDAEVLVDRAAPPSFLLAITHGSGGGVDTPDLLAVRDAAVALGAAVARVVQPYRVRGARAPAALGRQDEAWVDVIGALRAMEESPGETGGPGEVRGRVPLIVGGRSNGARLACRTARAAGAGAVIALSFPMHPPGHPERSRRAELLAAGVDVLAVSGASDTFGVPGPSDAARVIVLTGQGHSLSRAPAEVTAAVSSWLSERMSGGR
jgi:uncharacterized protein